MISKSDLVILVVASGTLAFGVYRWHQNTQDVSAITIPASNRVVTEPVNKTVVASGTRVIDASNLLDSSDNPGGNRVAVNHVVVQTLPTPQPVPEIVVDETTANTGAGVTDVGTHRVQSGDYLGKIAKQYGTDINTLRELNGISGSIIHVGQELLYPL